MSQTQKTQNLFNLLIAAFTVAANIGVLVWFAADIKVTVEALSQRTERIYQRVNELDDELSQQRIEMGRIRGYIERHEQELKARTRR
jgi:hypothetical protein